MVKKLYLTIFMAIALTVMLALFASAETVHNENTVDYSATVTLNDGTVLPLFDENKEALIWYISGTAEGKNTYTSIRSDSSDILWKAESWDEVREWTVPFDKSKIVVINLMDDDVIRNTGNDKYLGSPMDNFKQLFGYLTKLEYCYLRLDTKTINTHSFAGCTSLKYINLENLTMLRRMAQNNQFAGCSCLFEGQVLDLSKTQLTEFEGSETFKGVPVKGIKFPATMTKIGSGKTFVNCTQLEFISIGNKTKIGSGAFEGCTSLKAIYYVGTLDELNATTIVSLLEGALVKSYTEYKALSNKSGQYIVYNYSSCEAFNNGVHGEIAAQNPCVGVCGVCNDTIINHFASAPFDVTMEYADYTTVGVKVSVCQNKGCIYRVEEEAPALFGCLGYSVQSFGTGGISIGFTVNNKAIAEYKEITGADIKYGVFAASFNKLVGGDIFENGVANQNAVCAEIKAVEFSVFEIKITGIADSQRDELLALGAYVSVTKDGTTEYSYMQDETKGNKRGNYYIVSYNDIVVKEQ